MKTYRACMSRAVVLADIDFLTGRLWPRGVKSAHRNWAYTASGKSSRASGGPQPLRLTAELPADISSVEELRRTSKRSVDTLRAGRMDCQGGLRYGHRHRQMSKGFDKAKQSRAM